MEDYTNYSDYYFDYDVVVEGAAEHNSWLKLLDVVSVVIYSMAFVLGLLGNGVVIWVTACKSKRTKNSMWLLNLAIADFGFVLFLPFSIDYVLKDFHWGYGLVMCKLNSFVGAINMYASVLFLTILSVDRYVSLVHADWCQRLRNAQLPLIVCGCTWALSVAMSLPTLFFRDLIQNHGTVHCYNNYFLHDHDHDHDVASMRHIIMVAIRTTMAFVLPFTAIHTTGILLVVKLKRSEGIVRVSSFSKMVSAVIFAFFLCWVPFHTLSLMELSVHTSRSDYLVTVLKMGFPLATSLAFFHSCINPMLYMFYHKKFRHILKRACLEITKKSFPEINHSISASETSVVEDVPYNLTELPTESPPL